MVSLASCRRHNADPAPIIMDSSIALAKSAFRQLGLIAQRVSDLDSSISGAIEWLVPGNLLHCIGCCAASGIKCCMSTRRACKRRLCPAQKTSMKGGASFHFLPL